jgi:hypothetical protein
MTSNDKTFAAYVLTQVLPLTDLLQEQGGTWKITGTLPGYTGASQTFSSRDLAIAALVDHFYTLYESNPGLARGIESVVAGYKRTA